MSAAVTADIYNLIAATLSTIRASLCSAAMLPSDPTLVDVLSCAGCEVGALGGVSWMMAAAIPLRRGQRA